MPEIPQDDLLPIRVEPIQLAEILKVIGKKKFAILAIKVIPTWTGQTGQRGPRRAVTLVDTSRKMVPLTLWDPFVGSLDDKESLPVPTDLTP